ncbi:putative ADP-heptose-lipooligosaccharide heptosyltransferase [Vibrio ponticus]|nr:putative ADP-heptose-lipooligosaccharide heptosyltransferase [Vibrio ponticus]
MSQSLYTTLKCKHPDCTIDVLAPAWCKPILERMPEVNQAIEMPLGHGDFNIFARRSLGKELRRKSYTHAFVLPNSAKSALIPWFAGIPNRIGWKGELRYGLLTDLRSDKHIFHYMVERYVALASSKLEMKNEVKLSNCPLPALTINLEYQQLARRKLALDSGLPAVGLCPGAEFGPAKRWPDEHYAVLAKYLIGKGHQVWLFGSDKDRMIASKIKSSLTISEQKHCYNLAGKTSLIEAIDLLGACHTVISNDSGLMHVSAAVGSNVVAVYGSSSPKYTPPLTNKLEIVHTDIECRPCFKRECPLGHQDCLNKLMPSQVISAVAKFIE